MTSVGAETWAGGRWEGRAKHSAADATGVGLGRAVLGYVTAIMAIITLAPFRFASTPVHGLTSLWTVSDIVMNIVMFVPLGFLYQFARPAGAPAPWWHVFLLGAALSGSIETAQLFAATRYTSLVDVLTNATGALVGGVLHAVATRRIASRTAVSAVQGLLLELPLMGLVYLLVPLLWLVGLGADQSDSRASLVVLVSAVAGGILGTVHAAYLAPERRTVLWLCTACVAWYGTATLPSGVRDAGLLLAGLVVTLGAAWLRSIATARAHAEGRNRRFELPTLRLVLPVYAAYLALSSLWPLDAAEPVFTFTLALLPPGIEPTRAHLYRALEHVAAFTLVGYIVAEFHGRDRLRYGAMVGRVLRWGGGISLLLEATRGWHPSYGASLALFLLTVAATTFGGWLYHLQRDHVLALLGVAASATTSRPCPDAPAPSSP